VGTLTDWSVFVSQTFALVGAFVEEMRVARVCVNKMMYSSRIRPCTVSFNAQQNVFKVQETSTTVVARIPMLQKGPSEPIKSNASPINAESQDDVERHISLLDTWSARPGTGRYP
jgi:hypothetical protein